MTVPHTTIGERNIQSVQLQLSRGHPSPCPVKAGRETIEASLTHGTYLDRCYMHHDTRAYGRGLLVDGF